MESESDGDGLAIYGHGLTGLASRAKQNMIVTRFTWTAAEKASVLPVRSDRQRGALLIITFSAGSLFSSHYRCIMKRCAQTSSGTLCSSPLAPAGSIHPSLFIELFTLSLLYNYFISAQQNMQ